MTSLEYAKALNEYICNLEIVKEYQILEKQIQADEKLKKLDQEIKALQKRIMKEKSQRDEQAQSTIDYYEQRKSEYENHPLVVNYLYCKDEVNQLLQYINDQINAQIDIK